MRRKPPALGSSTNTIPIDLAASLSLLIPRAITWAEAQASVVLATGKSLDDAQSDLARRVGVVRPEKIRIGLVVDRLPLPTDAALREAALQAGLLGPGMIALTLGYAVLVCSGYEASRRILSHEFRHVHQYETAGSIAAFLPSYLQQVVAVGYTNAPYEVDARAYEYHDA